MKQLIPTTQYKKDLKRYAKQPKKLEALLEILRLLANEEPIPENCGKYRQQQMESNFSVRN